MVLCLFMLWTAPPPALHSLPHCPVFLYSHQTSGARPKQTNVQPKNIAKELTASPVQKFCASLSTHCRCDRCCREPKSHTADIPGYDRTSSLMYSSISKAMAAAQLLITIKRPATQMEIRNLSFQKDGPRAYFLCPLPLAASRAAALVQLVPVCASYEGRSRGLLKIRLRVPPAGRPHLVPSHCPTPALSVPCSCLTPSFPFPLLDRAPSGLP